MGTLSDSDHAEPDLALVLVWMSAYAGSMHYSVVVVNLDRRRKGCS